MNITTKIYTLFYSVFAWDSVQNSHIIHVRLYTLAKINNNIFAAGLSSTVSMSLLHCTRNNV